MQSARRRTYRQQRTLFSTESEARDSYSLRCLTFISVPNHQTIWLYPLSRCNSIIAFTWWYRLSGVTPNNSTPELRPTKDRPTTAACDRLIDLHLTSHPVLIATSRHSCTTSTSNSFHHTCPFHCDHSLCSIPYTVTVTHVVHTRRLRRTHHTTRHSHFKSHHAVPISTWRRCISSLSILSTPSRRAVPVLRYHCVPVPVPSSTIRNPHGYNCDRL
jgi:hypothetical protein